MPASITREQLLQLDKESLADLFLETTAVLVARMDQLVSRVEELEAQINKNSGNSSLPPSKDSSSVRDKKAAERKKSGRKPGGQSGHKGRGLKFVDNPTHIVDHIPSCCGHCGEPLPNREPGLLWRCQIRDIVVRVEVTEHRQYSCECAHCHLKTEAQLPPGVPTCTPAAWGLGIRSLIVYLMIQHHIPSERCCKLIRDIFGTAPSDGTLYNWQKTMGKSTDPIRSLIKEELVNRSRIGVDETGARGLGWVHCAVDPLYTWYGSHKHRGHKAVLAFDLITRFKGCLMSDKSPIYDFYQHDRSLCWAHALRDLRAAEERGHHWPAKMAKWIVRIKEQVERQGSLSPPQHLKLRNRFKDILCLAAAEQRANPVRDVGALIHRFDDWTDEYLRFATEPGAWFDNNIFSCRVPTIKTHCRALDAGPVRALVHTKALGSIDERRAALHSGS